MKLLPVANLVPPIGAVYHMIVPCPVAIKVADRFEQILTPFAEGAGGFEQKVKIEVDESVPKAFTRTIFPVDPLPRIHEIVESLLTLNEVGAVPPNSTDVVLVKFFPFITTILPLPAVVGEKLVIIGVVVLLMGA